MDDSQIVAKKLMPMQMLLCASPDYVRRARPAANDR
jgi:DNA-binding transcriptional LysR family regulator